MKAGGNEVTGGGSAARVFSAQPDRVAAAWRRLRYAEGKKGEVPNNLLDNMVEQFVSEVGRSLAGARGSAWTRTQGVLRVSVDRGARGLYEEFSALRRCMVDALDVLGAGAEERAVVNQALDEATQSAVALAQRFTDPDADAPEVPFGGLVVEYFERAQAQQQPQKQKSEPERRNAVH